MAVPAVLEFPERASASAYVPPSVTAIPSVLSPLSYEASVSIAFASSFTIGSFVNSAIAASLTPERVEHRCEGLARQFLLIGLECFKPHSPQYISDIAVRTSDSKTVPILSVK